jgi:hypothetical protein
MTLDFVVPGKRSKSKPSTQTTREYSSTERIIPESLARKIAKRWQWWRTWLRFGPLAVTSETERARLEPVHREAMLYLLRAGLSMRDITCKQHDDPRLLAQDRTALVELYLAARWKRAKKRRRGASRADIARLALLRD